MPKCDNFKTGCVTKRGVVEEIPRHGPEPEFCPACNEISITSTAYGISTSEEQPSHRRKSSNGNGDEDNEEEQAWTPAYIGSVFVEKVLDLVGLMSFIYEDAYRWGLFKSLVLFSYGVRTIFKAAQAIKKESDRHQRCSELKLKYRHP